MAPSEYDDWPIRKIADARDGTQVRVVGRIVACEGEPLVAPFTGRTCVAFDAAAWSHELIDEASEVDEMFAVGPTRVAKLVTRSLRARPFVIQDDTGRVVVDPRGAYVRLVLDYKRGSPDEHTNPFTPAELRFLDGVRRGERMEFGEGVLAMGEHVLVGGLVELPGAAADGLYRSSGDTRVRIAGSPDRPADVTNRRDELARAGVRLHDHEPVPVPAFAPEPAPASAEGRRTRQHVSGRMIIVPDE